MQRLNYSGNPILSLQAMLREISFRYPVIPRLIPSGLFDERTLEAVMLFQREFFPPVTGRVDNATWNAIVARYRQVRRALRPPEPCIGFPGNGYSICPGEHCIHLYLIQAMFRSLSAVLDQVERGAVSGVLDEATQNNTRWVQRLNQSEETGVIDSAVWNTLTRLYTMFISYAQTPTHTRAESLQSTPSA